MTTQIITIDGPVASGKGTVASLVADELGWCHLDSGALYRSIALAAKDSHISFNDRGSLVELAQKISIEFIGNEVYLDSKKVTKSIREEEIGLIASQIAVFPNLRQALLERQKQFAKAGNLVADGRDMGSVVFPDALLKIYLTASAEERAKRRSMQLGLAADSDEYQQIYQDILQRDDRDKNRAVAPLKPAYGARIIDSSTLSIDETVKQIINWYQELIS
ncbi:MAG: (d)CMP kinase [Neisseriaceae bacterium]|nr:MAG: (d)CMP kinase [Neisseriaceae bacterium]